MSNKLSGYIKSLRKELREEERELNKRDAALDAECDPFAKDAINSEVFARKVHIQKLKDAIASAEVGEISEDDLMDDEEAAARGCSFQVHQQEGGN